MPRAARGRVPTASLGYSVTRRRVLVESNLFARLQLSDDKLVDDRAVFAVDAHGDRDRVLGRDLVRRRAGQRDRLRSDEDPEVRDTAGGLDRVLDRKSLRA